MAMDALAAMGSDPRCTARPQAPPLSSRISMGTGALRLGVDGSLSANHSAKAEAVKTQRTAGIAKKARGVPPSRSQPKCAAQAMAAGADMDRSPLARPIAKAKR